jgi:hypothetical protein
MSDMKVDDLLAARPDLHVVYRQDESMDADEFDKLGDVLHALDYRFASANFHDGMIVVAGDAEVAAEWSDRMAKLVEAVSL